MDTRLVYLCLIFISTGAISAADRFSFEQVRSRARELAQRPFQQPTNALPENLRTLSYQQYQTIQFRAEKALWSEDKVPFDLEFFLPGFIHNQTVVVNEVTESAVQRVPFSPDAFSWGSNRLEVPAGLDYAGFRIMHRAGQRTEVGAFLDASYYRMIGRGQSFGASARALALNTVLQGNEEFPPFREFWVRKPAQRDASLTLWALMDSPSASGAFEFVVTPGPTTTNRTRAALFWRKEVQEPGFAPLTSMFLHDENGHLPKEDYRPEVHDSDGLLLQTGRGDWVWRPLDNGKMLRVNGYQDLNPRGFGLLQRDRDFEHYQDLVGHFEVRPSVWVQPLENWGRGQVELVQLPSNNEFMDNTVAFWRPEKSPVPGAESTYSYAVAWTTNHIGAPSLGYVRATRIGQVPGPAGQPRNVRFVIDFAGPAVEQLSAREQLDAETECSPGTRLVADTVVKNEVNGTWRLVMEILAPAKAVDLRAVLKRRQQPITETWTYTWQP